MLSFSRFLRITFLGTAISYVELVDLYKLSVHGDAYVDNCSSVPPHLWPVDSTVAEPGRRMLATTLFG